MNFSRPDDLLRCQVQFQNLRASALDVLGAIHAGALTAATDDPALLGFLTGITDRLERACNPDKARPVMFQD